MIDIGGNQGGEAAGRAVRADLRARLGDDPAGALRIEEADRPVGVDEVEIAIAVVAAEIAHVERGEDQAADVEDRAAADDDSRRRREQDRAAASPDAAQRIDDDIAYRFGPLIGVNQTAFAQHRQRLRMACRG